MTPLQKLPKNVRELGKRIVAKGFKKLPKVQKITLSGHTALDIAEYRQRQKIKNANLTAASKKKKHQ